ncbi:hypothetical protein [Chryseobacterium gleum]|uniref:hypothetical protein n=1 Tax=Chryseobacterium gleum TaxID=250 RepID=UPI0035E3DAE0
MKLFYKSSRFYLVISVIFVYTFIVKISSVYFGNSPLNKSKETKEKYILLFPQGWAFFTKEPRDRLIHFQEWFH